MWTLQISLLSFHSVTIYLCFSAFLWLSVSGLESSTSEPEFEPFQIDDSPSSLFKDLSSFNDANLTVGNSSFSLNNNTFSGITANSSHTWAKYIPEAIAYALSFQKRLINLETYLWQTKTGITEENGDGYLRYYTTNPEVQKLARNALIQLAAMRYLTLQSTPSIEDFLDFQIAGELKIDLKGTPLQSFCRSIPKCLDRIRIAGIEYRRPDGACNNPILPQAGMTTSGYYREIPSFPYYDDVIDHPRTMSIDHVTKLPSARLVSIKLHGPKKDPNAKYNLMFMQMGQFIAHDFTGITVFRPLQVTAVGGGYDCCSPRILANPTLQHPECFAMQVPKDDPLYGPLGIKCLNFLRAVPAPLWDCAVGTREQMNSVTAYIDQHGMYGSDEKRQQQLREFSGGRLAVSLIRGREFPPEYNDYNECSIPKESRYKCFKVGDDRANMHIQLVVVHVMFLRFHNQLARGLEKINPHWDDEQIFQEAKRINSAIFQHIAYGEHLPLVIGKHYMDKHDLWPRKEGYYHGYSQLIEGAASITVSHAAYRLHNLIVGRLGLYQYMGGGKFSIPREIQVADTYFDPRYLYNRTVLDGVIEGLLVQPESRFDRFMTTDVSQKLFHARNKRYGMDLAAVDIQRGRDTGLSGYNSWINFCGFTKFVDFDDLAREFDGDIIEIFKSLYVNVDDIELWSAGIHEKPLKGALVGKTFACLISAHFAKLKRGDRFWYENPMPGIAFSQSQLTSIRSMTMARIACDTGDNIEVIQRHAFLLPSKTNPLIYCNDLKKLPQIDLSLWEDGKGKRRREF